MFLKAALNGPRNPAENPALPTTPAQIAAEARASVVAGADAIHLHVRAADGYESLTPEDVSATLVTVRSTCPGIPVGISSGLWIVASPGDRLALVREWTVLPDFISVNFDEPGAAELAALLLDRGVSVEAGLANVEAARTLVESGLGDQCLRILLEPREQDFTRAEQNVAGLERALDAAAVYAPRLLHGVDATAWPLLREAVARGYGTRIGFEDTLTLPNGTQAESNAALVAVARQIAQQRSPTG